MFIIKIYTIFPNNFPLFDDELKTNKKSADKSQSEINIQTSDSRDVILRANTTESYHFIDMYAFYIVQLDINKTKIKL